MRFIEFRTIQVRGDDHVALGDNETVMSAYWDPSIDVYTATVMTEHDAHPSPPDESTDEEPQGST